MCCPITTSGRSIQELFTKMSLRLKSLFSNPPPQWKLTTVFLNWTICVISSDPPVKDDTARLTTVPLKGFSDQVCMNYTFTNDCVSLNYRFSFAASLLKHALRISCLRSNGETHRRNNFSKTTVSSTFWIRLSF